jgi:ribokinase
MRVILNPAPARELPQELFNLIDDIIPNQSELALLTGTNDVEKGIIELQNRGVQNVIITLGSAGAVLAQGVERHSFPAHRVKAVDTTAAGDSFVGAYAVALAEGATEAAACQMGVVAGAISVTASGAQASLPHRSAVDTMLIGTAA